MNHSPLPPWPFIPFGDPAIDELRIVAARGHYLYTDTGRRILDASAGAAVGNIGWGRPEVASAISASLGASGYVLPTFITAEREKLVTLLREHWLPEPLTQVSFMGSGSEAVDAAVRLARQYQLACGHSDRWKVIGRDVSYHGTALSGLAVGGHSARRAAFEPMLMDLPRAPACYCLRCPMGKQPGTCATECADALEQLICSEGADTIAAFIAEPIVGASGGALVPPEEYWPKIASICRKYGVLLIADEVMTGFGRTGTRFAVDHWNIVPDILVMGKGLSGGYFPISALATSADFCQRFIDGGQQPMYHTYDAHPAACAAAARVLEILQTEDMLARVAAIAPRMQAKMLRLQAHPHVAEVRGRGLLFAVEVVRDPRSLQPYPADAGVTMSIVRACLARDCFVYFGGNGEVRDIILVAPHFTITEPEIDVIVETLFAAIDEVCGQVDGVSGE